MNTNIISSDRLSPAEILDDILISVVIDASGSMGHVREETRIAANDYIHELQSGTPVTFSLGFFNEKITWQIAEKPVDIVKDLKSRDYITCGGTHLYDAIGESIARVEVMDIPPVHPIIVIFTDGQDAGSHKYTSKMLTPMIQERQARGWRFIAFIVGKKARISAERVGFLPEDIAEYTGDATSTTKAFQRLAKSTKKLVEAVEMKALPSARFLV